MPSSIDYLITTQHEKGGWGYSSQQRPVVEPTAMALLALRDEEKAESAVRSGVTWLLSCQNRDGGWGIHEDDAESGWQTAWALIALKKIIQNSDEVVIGEEWLATVGNSETTKEDFSNPDLILNEEPGGSVWPWLPNQVCWIEPTALAVLALKWPGSTVVNKRLEAAREYFRIYRTPNGGWDIGNAGPLDTIVLPRAFPTALVLMAQAKLAPDDIQKTDGYAIRQDLGRDQSILSRAAGSLALQIIKEHDDAISADIARRQLLNGSWENNPFYTAWACLALRGSL